MKLDARLFAVSLGCLWGLCVFTLGLCAHFRKKDFSALTLLSKVYVGYNKTVPGSFLGAVWGFFDGALSGFVIAWIYNKMIS